MDIFGPKYNADGSIECEIQHPTHGRIPFTARSDDSSQLGRAVFALASETAEAYEHVPTPATEQQVKEEAQRRIIALFGASDLTSCLVKQMNADARAIELTQAKIAGDLTPDEEAEAAAFQAIFDQVKAVRSASNTIELDPPDRDELETDERWP